MTNYQQKLATTLKPIIGAESLCIETSSERPFLEDRARLRVGQRELERQQNIERIVELATAESPEGITENPATRDWLSRFKIDITTTDGLTIHNAYKWIKLRGSWSYYPS